MWQVNRDKKISHHPGVVKVCPHVFQQYHAIYTATSSTLMLALPVTWRSKSCGLQGMDCSLALESPHSEPHSQAPVHSWGGGGRGLLESKQLGGRGSLVAWPLCKEDVGKHTSAAGCGQLTTSW